MGHVQTAVSEHPNALWFAEHERGLRAGDIDKWLSIFDPAMELHVPAALPWSPGELRGAAAIMQLWATMMEWSDNSFTNDVLQIIGGDNLVVTLNRVSAVRGPKSKTWDTVWVYRLEGQRVLEAFLLPSLGRAEVAEFWA